LGRIDLSLDRPAFAKATARQAATAELLAAELEAVLGVADFVEWCRARVVSARALRDFDRASENQAAVAVAG